MAYAYYTSIDALAAAIGANEVDFPVALVVTDARFATVANGGHIENTASGGASGVLTVPADFVASPNQDGSAPYDFEIVNYDATTGHIEMWVKITALDNVANTTVYLVYGDIAVVASQEDVAGTWSDNFHAVYHCADNGPANVALDTWFGSIGGVSSSYPGAAATRAIDGNFATEWASNGNGASSWIQINFDQTVTLYRIVLRDRAGADDWGDGNIEFSDTSTQAFAGLPVNGDPLDITISPPKSTDSIKIDITSGGAGNNRGFAEIQAFAAGEGGIQDSVGGFHFYKKSIGEPNSVGGQVGAGLDFDGSNDYAQVEDMDALTVPITLEMWVNPDTTTPVGIFDSAPSAANTLRNYDAGKFEWQDASPRFALGLSASTWQHLAFVLTHDGTDREVNWYKDGVFQAEETDTDNATVADFAHFRLGDINSGATGRYAGILDEFAISAVIRDADWVATRHTNQNDPAPASTFWSALGAEQSGGLIGAGMWPRFF